jgi:hypothetical protein
MTVRRGVGLGLVGGALLAGGFLVGTSLGDDPEASEFGSAPETLTTDRSDAQVPRYAAQKGLPALAVTSVEVATTEGGESEPLTGSPTAAPIGEEKKEGKTPVKTPPSTTPSPEPEITVGEEEKKKTE